MRHHRFTAEWNIVSTITIQVQRTDGGGPSGPHNINLGVGKYFVLDDGTASCLLEELEDAVQAAGTGEFTSFEVHRTDETNTTIGPGVVYFKAGTNVVIVVTWSGSGLNGEDLRDKLRFSGTSTSTPGTGSNEVYADKVHWGGFYTTRPMGGDLPEDEWRRTKSRQDAGGTRKEVHVYETIERIRCRILYGGAPRGPEHQNEWRAWRDFSRDVFRSETLFRWYMQNQNEIWIQNPYDEDTEPYGYETVTFDGPEGYRAIPYRAGLHTLFRDEIMLQRAEEES